MNFQDIEQNYNNNIEKKNELLKIILSGIEKKYGKGSEIYKAYNNIDMQKKMGLRELEIISSIYKSESKEIETQEQKIKNTISDFLKKKENNNLFHILKQRGFGMGAYHKRDVVEHTQNTLYNFRKQYQRFGKKVSNLLLERIDGITKKDLLELAIIFHDAGKMDVYNKTGSMKKHAKFTIENQLGEICLNFQLTKPQKEYIKNLIAYHDLPPETIPQEKKEYFIKNNFYIEYLLISISDLNSTGGPLFKPESSKIRQEIVDKEIESILNQNTIQLKKLL